MERYSVIKTHEPPIGDSNSDTGDEAQAKSSSEIPQELGTNSNLGKRAEGCGAEGKARDREEMDSLIATFCSLFLVTSGLGNRAAASCRTQKGYIGVRMEQANNVHSDLSLLILSTYMPTNQLLYTIRVWCGVHGKKEAGE